MRTEKTNLKSIYFSSMAASFLSVTFGISLTSVGVLLGKLHESMKGVADKSFIERYFEPAVLSVPFVGGFVGCILLYILPKVSQKSLLFIGSLVYIIYYLSIVMTQNLYITISSRFLLGFGWAISCSEVPKYIFSIAPLEIQGKLASFAGIGVCLGLILGSLGDFFTEENNWKKIFYISLAVQSIYTLSIKYFENSKKLGENVGENSDKTIMQLIKNKKSKRSLLVLTFFNLGMRLTGIDYVTVRLIIILEENFKDKAKYWQLASLIVSLLSALAAGMIVDKYGRKTLMLASAIIIAASTFVLGLGKFQIPSLFIYMFAFNLGFANIPWYIANEIFPGEYMRAGNQLGASFNWLIGAPAASGFSVLYNLYRDSSFFIYCVGMIFSTIGILLVYKETKGKLPAFQ